MSTDPLDNNGRAGFAAAALATYHSETRFSPDTYGDEGSWQFAETFGDLLGDLQHLARRAGVDFHGLLERGTSHFEAEVEEEESRARQAQEEEALKNGPVDDQVYAALTDDPTYFGYFKATSGLDPAEIRRSLLRLQEQGKAELVTRADTIDGKGWRRVTVPLEERVLSWLSEDKRTMRSSIEVDHGIEEDRLRACLEKLRDAGLIKASEGGWVRVPSNG